MSYSKQIEEFKRTKDRFEMWKKDYKHKMERLSGNYSKKYVLGKSTIDTAVQTARNLSAAGIVFSMDPFVIGLQLNPVPMNLPGIIIPSANNSKVSSILWECNNFS